MGRVKKQLTPFLLTTHKGVLKPCKTLPMNPGDLPDEGYVEGISEGNRNIYLLQ